VADDSEEGDDDREELEELVVGRLGRLTVAVPPDGAGEVVIEVRGGPERRPAWSDRPLPKHAPVVITGVRSDLSLEVTPFPD
jgi:hypothetical protein